MNQNVLGQVLLNIFNCVRYDNSQQDFYLLSKCTGVFEVMNYISLDLSNSLHSIIQDITEKRNVIDNACKIRDFTNFMCSKTALTNSYDIANLNKSPWKKYE